MRGAPDTRCQRSFAGSARVGPRRSSVGLQESGISNASTCLYREHPVTNQRVPSFCPLAPIAAGRMYLEGGRRGRANGDRGVDDARVVLVRVGNSIQLANRCESGDAVARWGNCSDCFVVRSLDCSCPARGVKRRSWFFASRSTCSGASRQRDRPSITPIVCCSSGCLAACQIKFWGPVAANPSPARANPGRTTPPIHPSVSLRQGQR